MSQTKTPATARATIPLPSQWPVAVAGLLVLATGAIVLGIDSWQLGTLFAIAGVLGAALYHASLGFAAAYRNAFVRREMSGIRAQIVMLGLATMLFAPVLASGIGFAGRPVYGALAPAGWEVVIGAFIFGIGMQLGGGCGSGALFTVGGGSTRMLVTLAFFCLGAFTGTLDWERWQDLRAGGASISLGREFGWSLVPVLQLGVLASIWVALGRLGQGRTQRPIWDAKFNLRRLIAGPWPLLLSGVLLALGNWLTLEISGHAWSITWGFTLWAAKLAAALGWNPADSSFWQGGFQVRAMAAGIFADDTSVMNFGIILGALAAAGLGGRFAPVLKVPARSLLAAAIGGMLLGYGARMAYGCNIGAFFSGAASTSLHGWIWIAAALPGNWIGVRLRPLFHLEV